MLLAGLYEPNEGDIFFDDQRLSRPFSARALGIGVIHQKPTLAEHLDIVSNIFLGNEIGWPSWLGSLRAPRPPEMAQVASRVLAQLGVQVKSLQEKVSNLSASSAR